MQLTRQKRRGTIMDDLHEPPPGPGLRPAPRIRIMANHDGIDTLLHLVHRQRTPRRHRLRQLGINRSQHIGINREQSAGHHHPDTPKINHPGREHRRHPRQPLMQTDRIVQQPTGRRGRHRQDSSHLSGHRLPRINPPQLTTSAILHRNLTSHIQLRDRRQPTRTRDILRTERLADRPDNRRIR